MTINIEGISNLLGEQAFTREEAAKTIGCSVALLDKMRRTGQISPLYLGDKPIYTPSILRNVFMVKEAA